jgi:hypothetical protein
VRLFDDIYRKKKQKPTVLVKFPFAVRDFEDETFDLPHAMPGGNTASAWEREKSSTSWGTVLFV